MQVVHLLHLLAELLHLSLQGRVLLLLLGDDGLSLLHVLAELRRLRLQLAKTLLRSGQLLDLRLQRHDALVLRLDLLLLVLDGGLQVLLLRLQRLRLLLLRLQSLDQALVEVLELLIFCLHLAHFGRVLRVYQLQLQLRDDQAEGLVHRLSLLRVAYLCQHVVSQRLDRGDVLRRFLRVNQHTHDAPTAPSAWLWRVIAPDAIPVLELKSAFSPVAVNPPTFFPFFALILSKHAALLTIICQQPISETPTLERKDDVSCLPRSSCLAEGTATGDTIAFCSIGGEQLWAGHSRVKQRVSQADVDFGPEPGPFAIEASRLERIGKDCRWGFWRSGQHGAAASDEGMDPSLQTRCRHD